MLKTKLLVLFTILAFAANAQDTCTLGDQPSVPFKGKNVFLSPKAKIILNTVVASLKAAPGCKLHLVGHGYGTYQAQQTSWDRVTSVTKYLKSKGIKSNRWIFEHGAEGPADLVDIMPVKMSEEGPSSVPCPIPCLSFHYKGKRCVDKKGNFKEGGR